MVGNEKDHIALRTAHKLNLTGPRGECSYSLFDGHDSHR